MNDLAILHKAIIDSQKCKETGDSFPYEYIKLPDLFIGDYNGKQNITKIIDHVDIDLFEKYSFCLGKSDINISPTITNITVSNNYFRIYEDVMFGCTFRIDVYRMSVLGSYEAGDVVFSYTYSGLRQLIMTSFKNVVLFKA